MINSKQRAYLRKLAMNLDPVLHIGKAGVTPEIRDAADEALEARELIKVNVQQNCMEPFDEIVDTVAGRTHADVIQKIGRKFVLYRQNKKSR